MAGSTESVFQLFSNYNVASVKELARVLAILLLLILSPLFHLIEKGLEWWQGRVQRRFEALIDGIAETDPERAAKLRRDDLAFKYRLRQAMCKRHDRIQEWFDQ